MARRQTDPRILDAGLQHERTTLAWERTGISAIVAGVLLARSALESSHRVIALSGLVETIIGGAMILWASLLYASRIEPIERGVDVAHPRGTSLIGASTVVFTGLCLYLTVENLSWW